MFKYLLMLIHVLIRELELLLELISVTVSSPKSVPSSELKRRYACKCLACTMEPRTEYNRKNYCYCSLSCLVVGDIMELLVEFYAMGSYHGWETLDKFRHELATLPLVSSIPWRRSLYSTFDRVRSIFSRTSSCTFCPLRSCTWTYDGNGGRRKCHSCSCCCAAVMMETVASHTGLDPKHLQEVRDKLRLELDKTIQEY